MHGGGGGGGGSSRTPRIKALACSLVAVKSEIKLKNTSLMHEVQIFWHRGQVKSAVGTCTFLLCDYCILTFVFCFCCESQSYKVQQKKTCSRC